MAVQKTVLSISRRSDIPAHHLGWLMACVEKGEATVTHPYTGRISTVSITPETVHSMVLWTKNPGPLLETGALLKLLEKGFHLFLNYTLNSPSFVLEPNTLPLDKRLSQMHRLCQILGPEAISWRFDPICHWKDAAGNSHNNLSHFHKIAHAAGKAGISRCITSFVDLYPKVIRRAKTCGITLTDPPIHEKVATVLSLNKHLMPLGISLFTCCENEVQSALPFGSGIEPSACIPGPLLGRLFGANLSLAKDSGQRNGHGCRCTKSREIGSYGRHPCPTGCLYCYAS
ncbi:MAG: DUF1848 domain-containing protein [Desulfobacterales bacterium]|nr:DUF1848 domain-containing protein [Desulfobacterales bacterium]